MTDLSAFPIAKRWPAKHPDRLQLYSSPTPNGVKISIALEEIGLPYEPHYVDIGKNESWTPEFLSLNPNGKIPAILDPNGPGGAPFALVALQADEDAIVQQPDGQSDLGLGGGHVGTVQRRLRVGSVR